MKKGIRGLLCYSYGNPSVSYTQLVVVTQKNVSELSETKEVKSKAAEVVTGEGNSVLAALTEHVAYLMATLDTKSGSLGNQGNRKGQQNRVNGPGNQGLGNNYTNWVH